MSDSVSESVRRDIIQPGDSVTRAHERLQRFKSYRAKVRAKNPEKLFTDEEMLKWFQLSDSFADGINSL